MLVAGAALLVAILLGAGIVLLLNGPPTTAEPNTINLSGALSLSQKLSPSCKLGANQTIYVVAATFPDSDHPDARYHYQLSFWIEAYHGPSTYPAGDFVLDKVVLTHLAPDPVTGRSAADATYGMADRSGQATVDSGGLTGSLEQDVAEASGDRVHISARWQCGHFEPLTQTGG